MRRSLVLQFSVATIVNPAVGYLIAVLLRRLGGAWAPGLFMSLAWAVVPLGTWLEWRDRRRIAKNDQP